MERILTGIIFSVIAGADFALAANDAIDYDRDIQPILSARCYECHSEKKSKADLRLDLKSSVFKGGESGPALVAGNVGQSLLVKKITSTDPDEMMPPKGERLTQAQIDLLKRWIAGGAPWPEAGLANTAAARHWAFKAPQRPLLPPRPASQRSIQHPIDRFVGARLDKEGFAFSPEADRSTLLRRVYLDVIGLPPSQRDLEAFLADTSAQAYGRAVDALLLNPHFGEKWARHWLDAARYADSDGFEKDKPRYSVWNYRDWVIKALNADLPYDQFIIQQIAGDQLSNATQESTIATGFLRNSMINEEGGVDPEQFRMDAMFDRMDCIGKSVLGLTIQCAQCHNHKYDPITHEDYYRMFAFLNSDHEPQMVVYSPLELQHIGRLKSQMREIGAGLRELAPDFRQRISAWADELKKRVEPRWHTLQGEFEHNSTGGQRYLPQKDGSFVAAGYAPTKSGPVMTAKTPLPRITAFRLELLTDPDLPCNGPGRNFKGTCALTEFEVKVRDEKNAEHQVKFARADADFSDPPETPLEANFNDKTDKKRVTGPASYAIDGKSETGWGIDAGNGRRNQSRVAIFVPDKPVEVFGGSVDIVLVQNHGGWNSDDLMTNNLGRFRISATADDPAAGPPLSPRLVESLNVAPATWSEAQKEMLFSHWRSSRPDFADANNQIEALWKQWPTGSTQLVLHTRPEGRQTTILKRGDWLKPSTPVTAGVPVVLHPVPNDLPPTRLTFARWLGARENPTTARVFVNRTWQQLFGEGLVTTVEDFGVRCEPPVHRDLLDWLAVEFMDSGWSVKQLLRLIVTSRTYKQSSRVTPEMAEEDPYNRFLARGPRFRVDAEIVRDIALAASGLLTDRIGGPSVMTPAPLDLFKPPASYAPFPWVNAEGADKYRRALYTFRRRSTPYPVLQTFDAPNGDQSCVRRARSNTPLQALTTLNEDIFVECARALARQIVAQGGSTIEQRLRWAFRQVLAREPDYEEANQLHVLISRQRSRVATGAVDASEVAFGAKSPTKDLLSGATAADLAVYTVVARVLLNLDEAITKE
ncbi:MAG: PSD1 and planctomycete cytochrome C domain-containing protein [Verrucomicrobiales bacterium]